MWLVPDVPVRARMVRALVLSSSAGFDDLTRFGPGRAVAEVLDLVAALLHRLYRVIGLSFGRIRTADLERVVVGPVARLVDGSRVRLPKSLAKLRQIDGAGGERRQQQSENRA